MNSLYGVCHNIENGAGAAGVRRFSFNSKGYTILEFSWGLGQTNNNHAKALEIYMGLRALLDNTSSKLVVIGDSDMIIRGLLKDHKKCSPHPHKNFP
jgi:ribonuclease HI